MSRQLDQSLFFGLDPKTKQPWHVREGRNGEACDRVCPGCGEPLMAVNAIVPGQQRPHFRHVHGNAKADCISSSLQAAVSAAAENLDAITTPSELRPSTDLFGEVSSEEVAVSRFVIRDFTDAVLELPDGRRLDVVIQAFDTRLVDPDAGTFDLVLDLPDEVLASLASLGALRTYLRLSPTAWRWCRKQTAPSMFQGEDRSGNASQVAPEEFATESTSEPDVLAPPSPRQRDPVALPVFWLVGSDGGLVVFRRFRAWSGVMLEKIERVAAADRETFLARQKTE